MAKGKKLNLTDQQINEIIKQHNLGLIDKDIATNFNIGRTTVGKILKQNGILNRHPSLLSREQEVINLFNKGYNQSYISNKLKMDHKNVHKILFKVFGEHLNDNSWQPKYNINSKYFNTLDSENKLYILGLLYADGCLSNGCVKLILQEQDKELLESINKELNFNKPLSYIITPKATQNNQYGIYINNRYIYSALLSIGLSSNKSLKITYPQFISPKYTRDFIRGYFDGDGCIYIGKSKISCTLVGNYNFCSVVKNILEKTLNIYCGLYKSRSKSDNVYVLSIQSKNGILKFLSWIYDDCDLKLSRKYNKYLEFKKLFA